MSKTSQLIRRNSAQYNKAICEKPTMNIIFSSEKQTFSPKTGAKTRTPALTSSFQHSAGSS